MTTLLTADLHLGHEKIIELSGRPYASVDEMDADLVRRWNETVAADDEVWVLGDYALGDRARGLSYLPHLNGTKYLVQGNHDRSSPANKNGHRYQRMYLEAGWEAVLDYAEISLPPLTKGGSGLRVMLSHYPYAGDHTGEDRYQQLRLPDLGKPLVHGHVHESWRVRSSSQGTPMVNVGVDVWDYCPVSAVDVHRAIRGNGPGGGDRGRVDGDREALSHA